VVFASGADLESGNPLVTIHPLSRQVQRYALFTTLARYDSSLAPSPYAATSWTWSADRRELTFYLLGGLSWHDGQPTTARDVEFTIDAARDPTTGYVRSHDLAGVDTVLVTNDTTVTLRFSTSQPIFPLVLCELPILPRHLLADVPRDEMRRASFNLDPVGNGPFRFAERVPGRRWVFQRNDNFPPALGGPPNIRQIVIVVVDEPTTKFAGLASGDLDFAGIAPSMAALADRDPTIRVVDYPVLFSTTLILNVHRSPFDDVRVRRAINLALDRDRILQAAIAGYGVPAFGPVPPESPYALERVVTRDPAAADSLLTEAGWMRSNGGTRARGGERFEVELLTVGSGDLAIEQLVQSDLAELGIRVDIGSVEMGSFLSRVRAEEKDFDMVFTGIPGDLSLAYVAAMYDSEQSGGALDYSGYHTAVLDSLFRRASTATRAARVEIWREVQSVLANDLPAVWIYHARGVQGISARMRNVTLDLRGELESLTRWSVGEIDR
jgi:peptide/nickel transport system substrate-binding protein